MDDPHDEHNIWGADKPPKRDAEPAWLWVVAAGVFIGLIVLLVGANL